MKDTLLALEWVSCIHYPIRFQKEETDVQALIEAESEIKAMTPAYALKLGLRV